MTKEEMFDYLLQEDVVIQQGVDSYILTKYMKNSIERPELRLTEPVKELLDNLIKEDILLVIGGQLILTNKYKELLAEVKTPNTIQLSAPKKPDNILNIKPTKSSWPEEIALASPMSIASVIQAYCNVPPLISNDQMVYLVNNVKVCTELMHLVDRIDADYNDIDPETFLNMIKTYYKEVKTPMAFKSLFVKNVMLGLYSQFEEHGSFTGNKGVNKDNNQTLL